MLTVKSVAAYEYRNHVRKRSFLIASFGIPMAILVLIGIIFLAESTGKDGTAGILDQAGLLSSISVPPGDLEPYNDFTRLDSEQKALEALQSGQIESYFVIPNDYLEARRVEWIYQREAPGNEVAEGFERLIQFNLLEDQPVQIRHRILEGTQWRVESVSGDRSVDERTGFVQIFIPFISSFVFYIALMVTAGYLLRAMAEEKEDRTIEILISSISPLQLILGKGFGLLGVGLSQLGIWMASLALALGIGSRVIPILGEFSVPWGFVLVVFLYAVPAFILLGGIMIGIAGVTAEVGQAQQIAGIINLLFMAPWFISPVLFQSPNSPILVFLTLFPTTTFLTTIMRWSVSIIPTWQLIAGWFSVTFFSILTYWLAARVFRLGMLRFGQPFRISSLLQSLLGLIPPTHAPSGQEDVP